MLPLKVETVVLCDDIRQEANGKYLLVGVYGANVVVKGFPADLRLSVWILGLARKPGKAEMRLRIIGPQEATLVEGAIEVEVKETATIIALPGLPLQVQREGKMSIEIASADKEDWTPVKTVDLLLAPRTSPPG